MSNPTITEEYRAHFTDLQPDEPEALRLFRKAGLKTFGKLGLPASSREEWRYNKLTALRDRAFRPANGSPAEPSPEQIADLLLPEMETQRLVFIDGRHSPTLSRIGELPPGATVTNLTGHIAALGELPAGLNSLADHEHDPFTNLNSMFLGDGLYLDLAAGVAIEQPIHLLFLSSGDEYLASPRNLINAAEGSRAVIIESYASLNDSAAFTNVITEVDCAPGADIVHYKLQRENGATQHIGQSLVRQAENSRYKSVEIVFGGDMTRRFLKLDLLGENAECEVNALYLARGEQVHDLRTRITHAVPNCATRELYKGIVDEKAHGIFDGLVYVARDAQVTDAHQTNRNLLLSQDARVNSMPRLEIYADDVKCSHGSTTGQLEEEQIFYLRSRGLAPDAARALLTFAFAGEIIDTIELAPLRQRLSSELLRRLPQGELIEETL
ncbi:MAG: Fe-S cluster assembly protein SufD [bacterium]|nr:Fe-S cluster assembly protein SufD [bacterium]